MHSELLVQLFPGISSFFMQESGVAFVRVFLILFGFSLAYLGYNKTLEPLIMVPMGIGMVAINSGVLFMNGGLGNIFLDPLVSKPDDLMNIMQINFLQPVYNLTFSNGLVACMVFMGIGAMSDIGFVLLRPWASMIIAIFAELGTFVTLVVGYNMGLPIGDAAAVATIGGADGPMVLFASLMMAPELFVPISIIAYLYLSLTYAGYPYIIKMLVPRKYRRIKIELPHQVISRKQKFIFSVVMCGVLCLLLPVAAPLVMSFFLGMAIREAEIIPYQNLLDNTILYVATLLLGLLLGVLCDAKTIMDPRVGILIFLGVFALAISAVGGILGGWLVYWFTKGKFNPAIGVAGVSCVPTTAKLAQYSVTEVNPASIILPVALGANICGVIVSAIATGVFISTHTLVK